MQWKSLRVIILDFKINFNLIRKHVFVNCFVVKVVPIGMKNKNNLYLLSTDFAISNKM